MIEESPDSEQAGIEITSEMIEAGLEIVGGFDRELDSPRETAVKVFQAMWHVCCGSYSKLS